MFSPCCTVSIPVIAQGFAELTLLLFFLLTSPYRNSTFPQCPFPCFKISCQQFLILPPLFVTTTAWLCPTMASLKPYEFLIFSRSKHNIFTCLSSCHYFSPLNIFSGTPLKSEPDLITQSAEYQDRRGVPLPKLLF